MIAVGSISGADWIMSGLLVLLAALAQPAQPPIVYFDLQKCLASLPDDSVLRYDTVKFVASLQGVVNRRGPSLVIRFLEGESAQGRINIDDYWLATLQRGWLKGRIIERIDSFEALLERFPESRAGVVLWDPAVPATANVAATVCGVEDWLPVRAESELYRRIVENGPKLPIRLSLVGQFTGAETGSAKCDAYLWAKRTYLDTGRTNPVLMASYTDAYTQQPGQPGPQYPDLYNSVLANHDYYIAWRAFFFDLSPWGDETPVDDPNQPLGADKNTLVTLLKSQAARNNYRSFTSVGGFIPWNLKYTNKAGGKHEPVPTEWEYAAVLSAHNAYLDADALGIACLCNASAYMHHPLQLRYMQSPRPDTPALEPKTYVLIYMGDYNSAAWLSRQIPVVWDDKTRGVMPMAWAFNPNLAARVPYVFDHVYRTKSPNDWFIAGDSGAGYLNPNLLIGDRLGSGFPEALDLWVTHNRIAYQRFGMTITGFVINGFHGDMPLRVQEAYTQFSPDGVGTQLGFEQPVVNGVPFIRHTADIYPDLNNLGKTAAEMARYAGETKPQFLIFRFILQTPGTVLRVRDQLNKDFAGYNWDFRDPYSFFRLYAEHTDRTR